MSLLINSLLKQFPHEKTAFGDCVIIPSHSFNPEWEQQLKGEGHKTFMQSWNGEASFFIPLEKSVTIEKTNSKFRKRWTETESAKLKMLFSQELSYAEIGGKLGRTKGSILGKVQRMRLVRFENPEPNNMLEPAVNIANDVVKEYLACVSELYPRYPHVCTVLLKEVASKILGEK